MNTTTLKLIVAIILIAHGWVHYSLTYVPISKPGELHTPYWPSWKRPNVDPTWLAARFLPADTARIAGCILWGLTLVGFTAAGLGLLGVPGLNSLWTAAAGLGSLASLLLLIFFWHPWLVVGVLIDVAVLVGVIFHLPAKLF